jgi:protease I
MKVLMVIAQRGFRDEELIEPMKLFKENDVGVEIASISLARATGMFNTAIQPDLTLRDVDVNEYSAIVIVGGIGAPVLSNYKELTNILKTAKDQDKIIAAICLAPMVLAKAGVIWRKKVTVFPTDESLSALQEAEAKYLELPVVVDGKIITANGPDAAKEFGKSIIGKLKF